MTRKLLKSATVYVKNLGKHAKRVVKRDESIVDAVSGISRDSKKLAKAVATINRTSGQRHAIKLTEEARLAYNERRYPAAEEMLRSAIVEDPKYALAYTYLGHSLYKQSKVEEAVRYWTKATIVDPGSDAAQRAQRKIAMATRQHKQVQAWLAEQIEQHKS